MRDCYTYNMSDILPIIVVYDMLFWQSITYKSLVKSVGSNNIDIFIYDNTPYNNKLKNDNAFLHEIPRNINLKYVHDPSNSGVSKAYNVGASYAIKRSKKFLLLLDQDTQLPKDFMEKIVNKINLYKKGVFFFPLVYQKDQNILISPCRLFLFRGRTLKRTAIGNMKSLRNISFINTGLCIRLDFFCKIGGFNEKIKLDFSDHEFIFRLAKYVETAYLIDSEIFHSLSCMEPCSIKTKFLRFKYYIDGGRIYSKSVGNSLLFEIFLLARGLYFVYKYKKVSFLTIIFKSYLTSL